MERRSEGSPGEDAGLASLTRRKLLLAGAMGGSSLLAGCPGDSGNDGTPSSGSSDGTGGGDGGGGSNNNNGGSNPTPTDVPDVFVEGQTLRLPSPNNPQQMYFAWQIGNEVDSQYSFPGDVFAATMEPGLWGRFFDTLYWNRDVPETYPGLYESVEIGADTISITIRDDATWSDGEPIRAKDGIAPQALWKEAPKWAPSPTETRFHIGAIGDYSMPDGPDGKRYELHAVDNDEWNEFGGFEPYGEGEILARIAGTGGVFQMRAGPVFPTHLDPYEPAVDEAIEIWDEKPEDLTGLVLQHVTSDWTNEVLQFSREPENIVTSGLWTVSELRGAQEVILEPNEHHRNVEDLNFGRIAMEWSENEQRTRAGIQAKEYDTGQFTASPQELPTIPDRYEQVLWPDATGYSLGLDHDSVFGERLVRQAVMFALNKEDIAGNIHTEKTRPIQIPGFDHWGIEEFFDESWAQENLIDYSQDTDRAASLMREAGFEKQSGVWQRNGQPFQITIATSRETPIMETTVSEQLSTFGVDAAFQTFESADFVSRVRGANTNQRIDEEYGGSGDFTVWSSAGPEDLCAGHYRQLWHHWWWGLANGRRVRRRNYFSHDTQESALEQYASNGWVRGNYPLWDEWTIDVPPVGEPDGTPQPFNPSFTWGSVRTGPNSFDSPFDDNPYYDPPEDAGIEHWTKQFSWVMNWWLPVLPLVLNQGQSFLNTKNWNWPTDHSMWQYFEQGWDDDHLAGIGRVFADADNPKSGANVRQE